MVDHRSSESRTKARTRRVILDAAVRVLGRQPSAALSDVATEAGVARSTVQRYYPERTDLLTALSAYADERLREAAEAAETDGDTAIDALSRLVQAYFELGDILMLTLQGTDDTTHEDTLTRLVERGHDDGTVDPHLPAAWIDQFLWSTLYAAWTHIRDHGAPKYESLTVCLRTFTKAIAT